MADIALLLFDGDVAEGPSSETRFGGLPAVAEDFVWPVCKTCGGNMQFLGQIRPEGSSHLLLLFMCQNDPGLCEEWDAEAGGNAVICTGAERLRPVEPPAEGKVTWTLPYAVRIEHVAAPDYEAALGDWAARHQGRGRELLGALGGEPAWLQADETPECAYCRRPMTFVAQLEDGPSLYRTPNLEGMNFGGDGRAYVFLCACEGVSGKFLWQC